MGAEGGNEDCLRCEYCTRIVGLWNFRKSKDSSGTRKRDLSKAGDPQELPPFDPIVEHYCHCSWVKNADSSASLVDGSVFELGAWKALASSSSQARGPKHLIFFSRQRWYYRAHL